jgi:hypothetical protein
LSWPEILSKAKALEQAEAAITEFAPAKDAKHDADQEDGKVHPTKPASKKIAKTSFFCKMCGPDQRHNTDNCKVVNGKIERLKGQKPPFNNNNQQDSTGNAKKSWNENKKLPAASYSTEQLKEVVWMTRKKAMEDVKTKFDAQAPDKLHTIEFDNDITQEKKLYNGTVQELEEMHVMEIFVNNPVEDDSDTEDDELTQAKLDELAASFSD